MGELKCFTVVTFHTSKSELTCGIGGLKCYTVVGGLKCYCGHASLLPSHPFPPAAWGPGIVEQVLRLQCWGSSFENVSEANMVWLRKFITWNFRWASLSALYACILF